jgi:hypothetical protein
MAVIQRLGILRGFLPQILFLPTPKPLRCHEFLLSRSEAIPQELQSRPLEVIAVLLAKSSPHFTNRSFNSVNVSIKTFLHCLKLKSRQFINHFRNRTRIHAFQPLPSQQIRRRCLHFFRIQC